MGIQIEWNRIWYVAKEMDFLQRKMWRANSNGTIFNISPQIVFLISDTTGTLSFKTLYQVHFNRTSANRAILELHGDYMM